MEYHGKLYGHLGGKRYFDTSHTTDEWDAMVKKIALLEAENAELRQSCVVGRSEQLNCDTCKSGLIEQLDKCIENCQKQADVFFERGMTISETSSLAMKVAYMNVKMLVESNR
jgi:hypothetical protein